MLKLDLTLFNGNTEGERYSDMSGRCSTDVSLLFCRYYPRKVKRC